MSSRKPIIPWTAADERLLTRLSKNKHYNYADLGEILDRPPSGVEWKMYRMNLPYKHNRPVKKSGKTDVMVPKAYGELKHSNGELVNYYG